MLLCSQKWAGSFDLYGSGSQVLGLKACAAVPSSISPEFEMKMPFSSLLKKESVGWVNSLSHRDGPEFRSLEPTSTHMQ